MGTSDAARPLIVTVQITGGAGTVSGAGVWMDRGFDSLSSGSEFFQGVGVLDKINDTTTKLSKLSGTRVVDARRLRIRKPRSRIVNPKEPPGTSCNPCISILACRHLNQRFMTGRPADGRCKPGIGNVGCLALTIMAGWAAWRSEAWTD